MVPASKNPANNCWPMIGCPASLAKQPSFGMIPSGKRTRRTSREIRREMHNDGKDLEKRLERKLDLDYGNEDWMHTAHFFPRDSVPFDIVEPIKNKMMQKDGDKTILNKHRNIWFCGYQSHKTKKRI
jgi:hypothetical protein